MYLLGVGTFLVLKKGENTMKKALIVANMLFVSATAFGMQNNQIKKSNRSEIMFSRKQLYDSLKISDSNAPQSKWSPQKWREIIKKKIKEGKFDYFNECPNGNGWTPLMYITRYSSYEILKELLELKDKNGFKLVDVNKQNEKGKTALMIAVAVKDINKFNLLLKYGADVNFIREEEIGWNVRYMLTAASQMKFEPHVISFMRKAKESMEKHINLGRNLVDCAKNGDLEGIKKHLSLGACINYRDKSMGLTALHQAIIYKQVDVFDFLLDQPSIDIGVKDKNGDSSLFFAAMFNEDPYVLRKLLSYKDSDGRPLLDVNESNNRGLFPLIFAINNGFLKDVKELLESPGIEVNKLFSGYTSLLIATQIKDNRFEIMQELIRNGADCNIKDKDGLTLLIRIVTDNRPDILKDFLTVNNTAKKEKWSNVKLLDVNDQDNEFKTTALIRAVCSNSQEIVDLLLKQSDVQIHKKDIFGHTALWYAASDGYKNIAEMLIEKYDSEELVDEINKVDSTGNTLWNLACNKANLGVIELLLNHLPEDIRVEKIPDVLKVKQKTFNAVGSIRKSEPMSQEKKEEIIQSFKISVKSQNASNVQVLLNAKDGNGEIIIDKGSINDALIVASSNGYLDVVKLLIAQDANIDFRDDKGNTSLMLAAKNGHYDVTSVLHNNGASLNMRNDAKFTALMLAADNGHEETVRMLTKRFKIKGQDLGQALGLVEQRIEQLSKKNRNGNKNGTISVYKSIQDILNVRNEEVAAIKNSAIDVEKEETYWPIFFCNNSKKELVQLERSEPEVYEKLVLELLQLSYDPFTKKKQKLASGLLPIDITDKHRLVYDIDGAEIHVVHCKSHYNDNANKRSRKDILQGVKFGYQWKNRNLMKRS